MIVTKEPRAPGIVPVPVAAGDIGKVYRLGWSEPLKASVRVRKLHLDSAHRSDLRRVEEVQLDLARRTHHLQADSLDLRRNPHRPDGHDLKAYNLPRGVNCRGQPRSTVKERPAFKEILRFLAQLLFLNELLDCRVDAVDREIAHKIRKGIIFHPRIACCRIVLVEVLIVIPSLRLLANIVPGGYPHDIVMAHLRSFLVAQDEIPIWIFIQVIIRHNCTDVRQRDKRMRPLERQPAFALTQRPVNLVLRVVVLRPTNHREQCILNVLQSYH